MVAIQVPWLLAISVSSSICVLLRPVQPAQAAAIHNLARRGRRREFKPNKERFCIATRNTYDLAL